MRLRVRAPPCGTRGVRARSRAAGQAPRAGLILEEVDLWHVERHSRLRSPDELAALHALLNDGSRHADVQHAADAVARELAADDEAQPPAQRGDDGRARLLLRARAHLTPLPRRQPIGRHREQRVLVGRLILPYAFSLPLTTKSPTRHTTENRPRFSNSPLDPSRLRTDTAECLAVSSGV